MPVIATPITPLEARADMFLQAKTLYDRQAAEGRPLSMMSEATEIFDTSDMEEDESDHSSFMSPKRSWESDSRRRSQTTISSYDEAPTPSSRTSAPSGQFELRFRPVEGPKGPHLFRASQTSAEFDFDYALQMSPLLSKEEPARTATAFTEETIILPASSFSLDEALQDPEPELYHEDPEAHIRSWSTQQVIDWMYETGIDSSVIECFDIHDINGNVLLDLEFDDLKELDIQSFGKRHQLWNAICLLRGEDAVAHPSPTQTSFQDISRPCTTNTRRSPSRSRQAVGGEDELRPLTPSGSKRRRGRKPSKNLDIVTPAESVSIVAIEQLLPKPHKCAKGERCAKWRKQQRELKQLHDDHGIGRFPISPTKGGRIFVAGDPGNALTADNMIPNVHMHPSQPQLEESFRPFSELQPSVVASSDLLGPGQLPEFVLDEEVLNQLGARDPQDNVKQFLSFQHVNSPVPVEEDAPPSPPLEMFPSNSISPYPAQYPTIPPPHEQLMSLPKLDIPRSASAGAALNPNTFRSPMTACRSATASPGPGFNPIYRLNTPASEVDVPLTAIPIGPIARDVSQSVPPNMQYRPQNQNPPRSQSRADWRRPSMALAPVMEGEVLSPSSDSSEQRPSITTTRSSDSTTLHSSIRDPAHHSPQTRHFGYGEDCTQSGWMKKRKTKMLRHEWQDAHFRLKGNQLTQHANARLSAAAMDTINVDEYSVACSSIASGNKLSAAMKALHIKNEAAKKKTAADAETDLTAFAFQLIPQPQSKDGEEAATRKKVVASGKTHHFAVKNKDERIEWMRTIMIAKALEQKGKGYEVELNGVHQA